MDLDSGNKSGDESESESDAEIKSDMSDPSDIDESDEEVCGPFLWTIQTISSAVSKVAQEKKVRSIHGRGLALIGATTTQETAIKKDKMRAKREREEARLAAKKQKEQERLTAKKAKEEAKASNPRKRTSKGKANVSNVSPFRESKHKLNKLHVILQRQPR